MIAFGWNLLLALAWTALSGTFSFPNLLLGFVLGYLALRLAIVDQRNFKRYFVKAPKMVGFGVFFLAELVKANWRVAYDVMTPQHLMRPGVLAVPLDAKSDGQIAILGNLISVTPGTLTLDVSSDRKVMYIHAMYIDDEENLRRSIKELERRVLDILS